MKILVVDDDSTASRLMRRLIAVARPDCEVLNAANGAETRDALERPEHGIDVVFLDLSLPDADGLELFSHFRDDPLLRSVQFILCTGSHDRETVTKAALAGVRHFIVKPPSSAIVEEKLAAALAALSAEQSSLTPASAPVAPLA